MTPAGMMQGMEDSGAGAGRLIVRGDLAGTVVAAIVGALGLLSADLAKSVLTPVSFALGALGIAAFLWSYFVAIERSRTNEISVSQLYTVAGDVAPPPVKRVLKWSLWAQVIIAFAVMVVGFTQTKPQEFNWAACAIVIPLFGFGMNGMWVARHGTFGPRILTPRPTRRRKSSPSAPTQSRDPDTEMEQNHPHG